MNLNGFRVNKSRPGQERQQAEDRNSAERYWCEHGGMGSITLPTFWNNKIKLYFSLVLIQNGTGIKWFPGVRGSYSSALLICSTTRGIWLYQSWMWRERKTEQKQIQNNTKAINLLFSSSFVTHNKHESSDSPKNDSYQLILLMNQSRTLIIQNLV